MNKKRIRRDTLIEQIREVGVEPGAVFLVHTSFSQIGPVEGGPLGLIAALQTVIGADGTLVMPSMSYDEDHAFDVRTTPCPEMGVVADTFWRVPRVLRSDSPHAFAAIRAVGNEHHSPASARRSAWLGQPGRPSL